MEGQKRNLDLITGLSTQSVGNFMKQCIDPICSRSKTGSYVHIAIDIVDTRVSRQQPKYARLGGSDVEVDEPVGVRSIRKARIIEEPWYGG
jgi:hypothetical protein